MEDVDNMVLNKENILIGFIGTGVMGKSMALNLIKKGYSLVVHNRTKSKAIGLIQQGAVWKDSIIDIAKECNVIITIIGYPKDVEEVYLGESGIIKNAKEGTYLIDMTTSTPSLAKRIYQEATLRKIYAIDAPVSGGDVGAREGRLAIMAGADREVFEAVKPIFSAMGKNIVLQGEAGLGQYAKMCNQIAIAGTMIGVCEALACGKKAGLDLNTLIKTIETGAAGSWSLSNYGPRIVNDDFSPGFFVKHFLKDLNIALESAKEMGVDIPGTGLAKRLYEKLAEMGEELKGIQALYKLWT
jgi:3-hydroxyisobutyrate dehydrogenase